MKLYKVPCGSTIRVISDIAVPLAAPIIKANDVIRFHHIDGIYSFCNDMDGKPVHLVAWAEVEIIDTPKEYCKNCQSEQVTIPKMGGNICSNCRTILSYH